MDTNGGKPQGGGGGGAMNWAIGIDMYTLMWIKLMTNKDLLYKKINKIKLKRKKKKEEREVEGSQEQRREERRGENRRDKVIKGTPVPIWTHF